MTGPFNIGSALSIWQMQMRRVAGPSRSFDMLAGIRQIENEQAEEECS